jgi:hypothetical protein
MSDIERRLHHAARELRSVEIELPPLGPLAERHVATGRRSGLAGRVPALVMPVLFVLGGLAVLTGGLGRTTDPPATLAPAPPADVAGQVADLGEVVEATAVATPGAPGATSAAAADGRPLSAHQEIALIAALAPAPSVRPDASPAHLRTLAQTYH